VNVRRFAPGCTTRSAKICSPSSAQSPSALPSSQALSSPAALAVTVTVAGRPIRNSEVNVTPSSSSCPDASSLVPSSGAAASGSVSRKAPRIGPNASCRAPLAANEVPYTSGASPKSHAPGSLSRLTTDASGGFSPW